MAAPYNFKARGQNHHIPEKNGNGQPDGEIPEDDKFDDQYNGQKFVGQRVENVPQGTDLIQLASHQAVQKIGGPGCDKQAGGGQGAGIAVLCQKISDRGGQGNAEQRHQIGGKEQVAGFDV